ncbi:hypothetical protein [Endozoicomonas numazuensis]|nr:hypothetical protein [Endozoicomonas numazuensis]
MLSKHEPNIILELLRQWIKNHSSSPSSSPCLAVRPNPEANAGEYCYPVTFVFKRDGEEIQLTDQQRDDLIGIESITSSLSTQLNTDREEAANNLRKMVGDLERTDMVICIDLGKDCQIELYSTAVHRSYLDKEISEETNLTKQGEMNENRKQDIATAVDYWVQKLAPGFQNALPKLVCQDALNEPFMAMPTHFKVFPTKKGKGDEGHKLVLNILDEDTVEVTASAFYDQYQKQGATTNKTHKAHILLKFSVRMERDGDLWSPVGCHCDFDLTTDKRKLESRRKSAAASPKDDNTQAHREFAKTSDALKQPMKRLYFSSHDISNPSFQHDLQSNSPGASTPAPKVLRSVSSTTPYQLSPPPESFHARQHSDGDQHLGSLVPFSLRSSTTASSSSVCSTSTGSHSPESSLIAHSKQASQLSEDLDSEIMQATSSPYSAPEMHCVTVGKQLYVTNMDHEKVSTQLRDNLVLDSFKKELDKGEEIWSKGPLPRPGRNSSSESAKLTNKLSMLANCSPSVSHFSRLKAQALTKVSEMINNPVQMDQISPETQAQMAEYQTQYVAKWRAKLDKTLEEVKTYQVSVEVDRLPSISLRPSKIKEFFELETEIKALREGYFQCIQNLEEHLKATTPETEQDRMLTLKKITDLQHKSIQITKKYRGSQYIPEPALDSMTKDIELTSPTRTPNGRHVQTYMEIIKSELSMLKMLISDMLGCQLYRMRPTDQNLQAKYDLKDHLVRDMFNTGLTPKNFDLMMKLVDTGVIEAGDDNLLIDDKGEFVGIHSFYQAKLSRIFDGRYMTFDDLQILENDTGISFAEQLSACESYDSPVNMSLVERHCKDFLNPDSDLASEEDAAKLFHSLGQLLKKHPLDA